jgi:hypothetical protein
LDIGVEPVCARLKGKIFMALHANNNHKPLGFGKPLLILVLLGLGGMWWSAFNKKAAAASDTPANAAKPLRRDQQAAELAGSMVAADAALPTRIERETLEPAARDPFTAYALPASKQPTPQIVAQAPVVTVPPPVAAAAPSPPPLNLRFLGQMIMPSGERMIYVAFGESELMLMQGQTLPNGYQVTSINARQVNLTYAPLAYTTQLSLPEAPRYEVR